MSLFKRILGSELVDLGICSDFPLINAVLLNLQEGKIFQDDSGSVFVCHKAGFSELLLSNGNANTLRHFLDFLISEKDVPQYFHIYNATDKLAEACAGQTDNFNLKVRTRIQLVVDRGDLQYSKHLPQSFYKSPINKSNINYLDAFDLALGSKFWNSCTDFLESGFGNYVHEQSPDTPASICYSACIANGVAEIDVATLPPYRQRGLAKIAVSGFMELCNNNHIRSNWDCFSDNIESIQTARSLGFKTIKEYLFLSIFKNKKETKYEN